MYTFKAFLSVLIFLSFSGFSQGMPEMELTKKWIQAIESNAPSETTFKSKGKKRILVFSLHTGFKHWVIPFTEKVVETISEKSGAFEVVTTKNIRYFEKASLKEFDAVVLNNTCSIGDRRDIFWDIMKEQYFDDTLTAKKIAAKYEKNLLKYVKGGGGLAILHGGIVMQNKSMKFSEVVGGSFFYHPAQQQLTISMVDKNHPLVEAFEGKDFVHVDEPYLFNNAYDQKNFRPLLYFKASEVKGIKESDGDAIRYVSWIKKHGRGRVFYSSPSHNAQSYSDPRLLRYLLNGLQYVVGDVKCDETPMGVNETK